MNIMRNYKKFYIFFLSCFLSFYSYGQHCDSILWAGHNTLKWKHFKGYPDRNSLASALTESSINYRFTTTSNIISFKFYCSFSTCASWLKAASSYTLLEHEQVHFDLAEYHRRLMVKEVVSQKFTVNDIGQRVDTIARRINALRIELDALYDVETNFSRNGEKQKDWQKKIRKMMKALDDYDKLSYLVRLN